VPQSQRQSTYGNLSYGFLILDDIFPKYPAKYMPKIVGTVNPRTTGPEYKGVSKALRMAYIRTGSYSTNFPLQMP